MGARRQSGPARQVHVCWAGVDEQSGSSREQQSPHLCCSVMTKAERDRGGFGTWVETDPTTNGKPWTFRGDAVAATPARIVGNETAFPNMVFMTFAPLI